MVASAANGFMNTNFFSCNGTPFNFQPLFNTARPQNSIEWSVLISGILNQFEIGHFEPCSKVTGKLTIGLGPGVSDTTWLTCHGAYEAAGPPDPTQGGQEPTDALCYKKGDTHGSLNAAPNLVRQASRRPLSLRLAGGTAPQNPAGCGVLCATIIAAHMPCSRRIGRASSVLATLLPGELLVAAGIWTRIESISDHGRFWVDEAYVSSIGRPSLRG